MAHKKSNNINRKNINKGLGKLALIAVFILLIIIIIMNSRNDSKNLNYEKTQIILNNVNITNDLQDDIILQDNNIYMSIDDVKKFLDETVYEENELIITTSKFKIATLSLENTEEVTINGSKQEIKNTVIKNDDKKYIAISELEKVYNYEFQFIENTNIVTIDNLNKELITAEAKKNITIKEENKIFSKSIEKIKKGDKIICINEEKGKTKVRTQNGNIGYVSTKSLTNIVTQRENFDESIGKITDKEPFKCDITQKDISTFEKREKVINLLLQELIKNDNMYVKFEYNGEENFYFERFKIEATPIMQECGITVDM